MKIQLTWISWQVPLFLVLNWIVRGDACFSGGSRGEIGHVLFHHRQLVLLLGYSHPFHHLFGLILFSKPIEAAINESQISNQTPKK